MSLVIEHPAAPRSGAPELLNAAGHCLAAANAATRPVDRYAAAHLAALRGAAAVLAVRAQPVTGKRRRPRSAWELLVVVAPELSEWAAFFAANAGKRAAAEAGLTRSVTAREADDLMRDAATFVALVAAMLDVPCPQAACL
ncbi:hypothetical protein GCM10009547_29660 [Sporichthya brevicatena]|uniref:SAV-6107-like HEPN domain-containing protein n=1 Tax=Sporichthya brevicatena TaxID=171442 RepID=A0ABN1GZI0_9ACTN